MLFHLVWTALVSIALMFFFYVGVKRCLIFLAFHLANKIQIKSHHPFETIKGSIELPLIVAAHFVFAFSLLRLTGLNIHSIGLFKSVTLTSTVEGILLGVGLCGMSFLLILIIIEFNCWIRKKNVDRVESYSYVSNWLNMARSGWMRHHINTLEVLPRPIAFAITFGQVTCEEIVFKGVIVNYYWTYSLTFGVIWSVIMFTAMQIFFMPSYKSAIFPMMGGFVVGTMTTLVYLQTHNLYPLLIAHFCLFVMAVL